jgi:drug/metabolite transporter (DMT)-like permease
VPSTSLKSDVLLLLTAVIWGFAFVFQRIGMDYVGPFTYSATRFTLGVGLLLPLAILSCRRGYFATPLTVRGIKPYLMGGALAGLALFGGISFQQVGLVYTTAGKAGFITGLYVVIVPIMGLLWRTHTTLGTWVGAVLAAVGLYLLSITADFSIAYGDLLVLCGAFVWAAHVHILGRAAPRVDPVMLATLQYAVCALFSWIAALLAEEIAWDDILQAAIPILYGGGMSVAVAYTLQVVAQRNAHPAHAAILLSLESVFAALGGWMVLHESLSLRSLVGCALMLAGMLISQLHAMLKAPGVLKI